MLTNRLERGCFVGLLLALIWAPLPFASNRPWAGALLCLIVAVLFAAWWLLYLTGRARPAPGVLSTGRTPLLLLVAMQAWVALQLVPLPPQAVALLSPLAGSWHLDGDWQTLSLDPAATRLHLMLGIAYTMGFWLVLALANTPSSVRLLLQALVFSGTAQALYGAFMVLSGMELGFFVEKYAGRGAATGTFVNANHLAGYLVMALAAGTGLLLAQLSAETQHGWRARLRGWMQLLLSPKIRLRIYLAIMVIALVMTRSRTGNVAFFLALAAAGGVALCTGQRFSRRVLLFLASLFLVDMLILSRWFGLDRLVARLGETSGQAAEEFSRYWMNLYSLDYLRDFSLTGSGGRSFATVFPNYQGPQLTGYFQHAHNDYLEFAVELGLPGLLLGVAVVGISLWHAIRVQYRHRPLYRGVGFAITLVIAWAALHSVTDFNLQIPANALTFAVLLALVHPARALQPRPGSGRNVTRVSSRDGGDSL